MPRTATGIVLNVARTSATLADWHLHAGGIGLARMELVIDDITRIRQRALLDFDRIENDEARKGIAEQTRGYADNRKYVVDNLAPVMAVPVKRSVVELEIRPELARTGTSGIPSVAETGGMERCTFSSIGDGDTRSTSDTRIARRSMTGGRSQQTMTSAVIP